MTALHFINPDQNNIHFSFLIKALKGSSNPIDTKLSKNFQTSLTRCDVNENVNVLFIIVSHNFSAKCNQYRLYVFFA